MKLNKLIIFLFFMFFISCSRIGFYVDDQVSDSMIQYRYSSSTECSSQDKECNTPPESSSIQTQILNFNEEFTLVSRDDLEILFVIDVSGSMDDNLKKIGKNMEYILSHISHKNWRMAFTTADHGDHVKKGQTTINTGVAEKWENYKGDKPYFGKFMNLEKNGKILDQYILNKNTEDFGQIFKDTLTREDDDCDLPPYCQGNLEQPLRALKSAINRQQLSSHQFFRAHTDTIVLIITDEDERVGDHINATTAQDVIQTYNQVFKGQNKRLFGFSISIQDKKCYEEEKKETRFLFFTNSKKAEYGRMVGELATFTGGTNISLCTKNYSQSLLNISQFAKHLVESSVVLDKLFYIPRTVKISLSPVQPNISWKFYGRKVVFSDGIQAHTKIRISYQYEE